MTAESPLHLIVRESGLESTKAQFILNQFQTYFAIAAEWEARARRIVVTDASQTVDMQIARTGRLFLREKRIALEKARKSLKEQALREGKAIDGIANVLKGLIEPIEKYLEEQEHFVAIQTAKETERQRQEAERQAEAERVATAQAEEAERQRIAAENAQLKREAAAREQRAAEERQRHEEALRKTEEAARTQREQQERRLAAERAKAKAAQDKAAAEKRALEEKARKERDAEAAQAKAERDRALAAERAKLDAERAEKERLAQLLANQIECPVCHAKFDRREAA